MSRDDPYHDMKPYHFAAKIRSDGAVSALCFKISRPINLRYALWTNRRDAVTCQRCRQLLSKAAREAPR